MDKKSQNETQTSTIKPLTVTLLKHVMAGDIRSPILSMSPTGRCGDTSCGPFSL